MAKLEIKEKVNSFKKLYDALQGGFKKELGQIGIYMESSIKKNIDEGIDIRGIDFIPLSQRTIDARRKGPKTDKYPVKKVKILRDTGRLQNSYTHNVKSDSVEIGTNVPYAVKVNFGWEAGYKRIPPRKHVGFSEERKDKERIKQILIDGLKERFK